MKLFHLSDLHLGKRVNEFSMLEDQQYILSRILEWVHKEKPDVLICLTGFLQSLQTERVRCVL